MSLCCTAPSSVEALARGPNFATAAASVAGPLELLSTTRYPAWTANSAMVEFTFPKPTKPTVVTMMEKGGGLDAVGRVLKSELTKCRGAQETMSDKSH